MLHPELAVCVHLAAPTAGHYKGSVTLLDYGAGNVRSVRNAIRRCGYDVVDVTDPADILKSEKLIFPGVGSFGASAHHSAPTHPNQSWSICTTCHPRPVRLIYSDLAHAAEGYCMKTLVDKGFIGPLKQYIAENRPLLGVCLGMQARRARTPVCESAAG
jgi:glutamine amidotransferase/cyclase